MSHINPAHTCMLHLLVGQKWRLHAAANASFPNLAGKGTNLDEQLLQVSDEWHQQLKQQRLQLW